MNRKGAELPILFFVLLMILLAVTILFLFYFYNGKHEAIIGDARFVEGAQASESKLDLYVNLIGERAVITAYRDVLLSNSVMTNVFDSKNMNFQFLEKSKINFKNGINSYDLTAISFNSLKDQVVKDSFDASIQNNSVGINVQNIKIESSLKDSNGNDKIHLIYNPQIGATIDLGLIGLDSFDNLYSNITYCKSVNVEGAIADCLNGKLSNFAVSYVDGKDSKSLKFETRRKFVLNGDLNSIGFNVGL